MENFKVGDKVVILRIQDFFKGKMLEKDLKGKIVSVEKTESFINIYGIEVTNCNNDLFQSPRHKITYTTKFHLKKIFD